jgi:hypothetical protein
MSKNTLVICDSHMYAFSEIFLDSGFEDDITYIPILFYKDALECIANNSPLIHYENAKWGINREQFDEQVDTLKIIGNNINYHQYKNIVFIGHFLLDRIVCKSFVQGSQYYPDIYSNSFNSDGILFSSSSLLEVFKFNIERTAINAIKLVASIFDGKILVIPGPCPPRGVIESILQVRSKVDINSIDSIFNIHRSLLRSEFQDLSNVSLPSFNLELQTLKNGFLSNSYTIDTYDIHANASYGKLIFNEFIKIELNCLS